MLNVRPDHVLVDTVPEWMATLKEGPSHIKEEMRKKWALIGAVAWAIWKERCKAMHDQRNPSVHHVISTTRAEFNEFWVSRSRAQPRHQLLNVTEMTEDPINEGSNEIRTWT